MLIVLQGVSCTLGRREKVQAIGDKLEIAGARLNTESIAGR
jgi:hypothetical protein